MWKKSWERGRFRGWITRMIWIGKRGWFLYSRKQDGPKKRDGLSLDIGREQKYMLNGTDRILNILFLFKKSILFIQYSKIHCSYTTPGAPFNMCPL